MSSSSTGVGNVSGKNSSSSVTDILIVFKQNATQFNASRIELWFGLEH